VPNEPLAAALPQAAADITTATAEPSPSASATIVVLTFEPEPTFTVVFVAPTEPPATAPAAPPTAAPAADTPVPPPPTAIVPPPPPSDPTVAGAEQGLIDQVNYQRAQYGLAPYARDETLMQIARGRIADMLARNFFSHYDPLTGAALAHDQIWAAGYSRAGENIYGTGSSLADLPANAVAWFMSDPPHRDNLLHVVYTAIGAGIGDRGTSWIVVLCFAA
jgi:uncharacterized protein YkwD